MFYYSDSQITREGNVRIFPFYTIHTSAHNLSVNHKKTVLELFIYSEMFQFFEK